VCEREITPKEVKVSLWTASYSRQSCAGEVGGRRLKVVASNAGESLFGRKKTVKERREGTNSGVLVHARKDVSPGTGANAASQRRLRGVGRP
jgi:hypothetical protein